MESLLTNFSEAHRILSYLIVFFSIFIEGEIILLLAGVLSHRGHLDIFDVIMIASVAAILHDLLYWSIGQKLSKTSKKKIWFIDLEKVRGFLEKLRLSNGLYIFISKFAWNLNRVILIASGYLKMPVKELMRYSVPASFVWSITFVSLGYVFAFETNILKKDFKTASLILVGFIIVIIVLENLLRKMLEKRTNNK
jgi:membrane protein DedA with SNARE-associated domain